ncbi:hypothetical protein C2E23DRAFT_78212 [Lenzites betulinus]|nr:hypothetical protein C2E23DRAFT_78212 [Lenzites betulinus]
MFLRTCQIGRGPTRGSRRWQAPTAVDPAVDHHCGVRAFCAAPLTLTIQAASRSAYPTAGGLNSSKTGCSLVHHFALCNARVVCPWASRDKGAFAEVVVSTHTIHVERKNDEEGRWEWNKRVDAIRSPSMRQWPYNSPTPRAKHPIRCSIRMGMPAWKQKGRGGFTSVSLGTFVFSAVFRVVERLCRLNHDAPLVDQQVLGFTARQRSVPACQYRTAAFKFGTASACRDELVPAVLRGSCATPLGVAVVH